MSVSKRELLEAATEILFTAAREYSADSTDNAAAGRSRQRLKLAAIAYVNSRILTALPSGIDLHVTLTDEEISSLQKALEHVRVHMAHEHPWQVRDTAMEAIGKVLAAARPADARLTQ